MMQAVRELQVFRFFVLLCFVLCFVPLLTNTEINISAKARINNALESTLTNFSIVLILGSCIALIADDLLYFLDITYVSVGYQWSRRALILSIIIPYILMYNARLIDDLSPYYCSFNASFLLQSYAITDPLIAYEQRDHFRHSLFLLSLLRLLSILGMNFYYFIDAAPPVFYMTFFGTYAVVAISLTLFAAHYIYVQYALPIPELAVVFFSICIILNVSVRLVVPLAFGNAFFHKFSTVELFCFHIISIAITCIATIMPGRMARHNGILTKLALEKQKVVMRYISHEMRTPLNTIHLGIDELLRESEHSHDVLLDMQAAAELSEDTLNDLIAQDDTTDRWLSMDCEEISAYRCMTRLIADCQKHAAQGNFHLELHQQVELAGYMLYVDSRKLNQALRSIIITSSKMTHSQGHVRVQCSVVYKAGLPILCIEIHNDGPEISQENRGALFEVDIFYTLNLRTGIASTLALKTSKGIIECHEGSMEVITNNHSGVGFRICLPLQQLQLTELTRTSELGAIAMLSDSTDITVRFREKNEHPSACLIVDDAAVVRKMIARVVKDLFDQVYFAEDGQAALEMVHDALADIEIIFMDRCMPLKDGIEATRDIRNMGFQGVILGVTGDALAEDVDAFLQAGADKVVTKPVRPAHFLSLIKEHRAKIAERHSSRWSISE